MNDPRYPNPDDRGYSVAFCYEFLEDAKDNKQRYKDNYPNYTAIILLHYYQEYMKVARGGGGGGGGGEESIEHAICTVPTVGKVT